VPESISLVEVADSCSPRDIADHLTRQVDQLRRRETALEHKVPVSIRRLERFNKAQEDIEKLVTLIYNSSYLGV